MKKNLVYGVKFTYKRKDKGRPEGEEEKTIQYIVEVTYTEESEGNLRCVLNRKGFAVNGGLVHRLMDVFAEKCSGVLYPFVFRIGRSGVLLGIDNFEEIRERWTNALPGLQREYTGAEAEKYLDRMSGSLASVETFRQAIRKDMFYYLFFMQEAIGQKEENIIRLPLVPGERPVSFKCGHRLKRQDTGYFRLEYTGTYASDRVRYRTRVKDGNLNMSYTWEKDGVVLKKMEGVCHLVTGKEREISFKITRI
ncbi:hypothetical protein [Sinomicrobium soli]|uniref:hypothetical protein n=1 Tax=Sinomicrobium sp. N-1-3-6 TaxID=2219864 RepID=UPI000DCDA2A6|nr:hypothetical protein [Sinomicrobium sp. N-1-3-6]RAV30764.1 hypothetical protein DN748_00450 [Sinomicrobium sp. N-1-3-6]